MKKFTLLLAILLIAVFANAQITFQKAIGGSGIDVGYSIIQTNDGGYALTGGATLTGADEYMYVVKLDSNGNLQWKKGIGGVSYNEGHSIIQTSDSGYAVCGYTSSFGFGNPDVYVVKLNKTGNVQWKKIVDAGGDDYGRSVVQTTDGGYIVGGYTDILIDGFNHDHPYIIKLDGNGNLEWTKIINGNGHGYCFSVIQSIEGGYALGGYTSSYGAGSSDIYVVKLDTSGNIQWTKTIGGSLNELGQSIIQTTDSGYVICGETYSFGSGYNDVYIVKLNTNGNLQWTKTIGNNNYEKGMSIFQTSDNGFAACGTIFSFGVPGDIYVIKLDSTGHLQWTKTIGDNADDWGYSIIQSHDGSYVICGLTNSYGAGSDDVFIVKLDSNGNGCGNFGFAGIEGNGGSEGSGGTDSTVVSFLSSGGGVIPSGIITNICTSVGINEIKNAEEPVLFPNPFTDKINITNNNNTLSEIILYDVASRKLLQQSFTNSVTLNTSQLAKGIYIYEVRNKNGEIKKGKVVKE